MKAQWHRPNILKLKPTNENHQQPSSWTKPSRKTRTKSNIVKCYLIRLSNLYFYLHQNLKAYLFVMLPKRKKARKEGFAFICQTKLNSGLSTAIGNCMCAWKYAAGPFYYIFGIFMYQYLLDAFQFKSIFKRSTKRGRHPIQSFNELAYLRIPHKFN